MLMLHTLAPSRRAWRLPAIMLALVVGCGEDEDPEPVIYAPLVETNPEPAGENCPAGGLRVDSGLDANQSNRLEGDEITSTAYACNGVDGSQGADGSDGRPGSNGSDGRPGSNGSDGRPGSNGSDGTPGSSALVRVTRLEPGELCPAGGVHIHVGLDTNQDGVLDDDEIDPSSSQAVCDAPLLCYQDGLLPMTGQFLDGDGRGHWLTENARGFRFYTYWPNDTSDPEHPFGAYQIDRACDDLDRLVGVDIADPSSLIILDYSQVANDLLLCRRSVADYRAAVVTDVPDWTDRATGCGGNPVLMLETEVVP